MIYSVWGTFIWLYVAELMYIRKVFITIWLETRKKELLYEDNIFASCTTCIMVYSLYIEYIVTNQFTHTVVPWYNGYIGIWDPKNLSVISEYCYREVRLKGSKPAQPISYNSHVTGAPARKGAPLSAVLSGKSHILPLMSNFGRGFSQMVFESYYLNRTHLWI